MPPAMLIRLSNPRASRYWSTFMLHAVVAKDDDRGVLWERVSAVGYFAHRNMKCPVDSADRELGVLSHVEEGDLRIRFAHF